MVRRVDVERASLDHEDPLLAQEVEYEAFVVDDVEPLPVELRKGVQGTPRFDATDPFDLVQHGVGDAPLFVQAASRGRVVVDALMAAQGTLDGVLGGHVGAQPHGCEDL